MDINFTYIFINFEKLDSYNHALYNHIFRIKLIVFSCIFLLNNYIHIKKIIIYIIIYFQDLL